MIKSPRLSAKSRGFLDHIAVTYHVTTCFQQILQRTEDEGEWSAKFMFDGKNDVKEGNL